jgi:putative oxidoreductase
MADRALQQDPAAGAGLGTVTLLEVAAGLFALVSAVALLLRGPMELGVAAMALSCLTLVMLLVGQRIAKDYAGAGTLAAYFMIALFGLWLMGPTLP